MAAHPAVDRVGSSQHGAAGIEASVDAGLGDGDAALLHHLVNGGAVHIRHFVELVDAHHAPVTQNHGSRLQPALAWKGKTEGEGTLSRETGAPVNVVPPVLPVSWSVVTAAVKPTPDEPRPVVGMARGAVWRT